MGIEVLRSFGLVIEVVIIPKKNTPRPYPPIIVPPMSPLFSGNHSHPILILQKNYNPTPMGKSIPNNKTNYHHLVEYAHNSKLPTINKLAIERMIFGLNLFYKAAPMTLNQVWKIIYIGKTVMAF